MDSKEEARAILPPLFRQTATITALQSFRMEDIEQMKKHHED
jgi:hypothetical protein